MHPGTLRFASAACALAFCACSPLTPSDTQGPGPFTSGSAGTMHNAANAHTGESSATGANTGTISSATTFIIAKHQATQRQRQVAIQRAQAAQKQLVKRQAAAAPSAPKAPKAAKAAKKKLPRYIAVATVREASTSPKAKAAVMIWDTQAEEIVGNNVYDISNPPPVGATSRFETYSAEYVGAGL